MNLGNFPMQILQTERRALEEVLGKGQSVEAWLNNRWFFSSIRLRIMNVFLLFHLIVFTEVTYSSFNSIQFEIYFVLNETCCLLLY